MKAQPVPVDDEELEVYTPPKALTTTKGIEGFFRRNLVPKALETADSLLTDGCERVRMDVYRDILDRAGVRKEGTDLRPVVQINFGKDLTVDAERIVGELEK